MSDDEADVYDTADEETDDDDEADDDAERDLAEGDGANDVKSDCG